MTKPTSTRRTVLKGIGVLAGAGTAALGTVYYSTESAVATASFTAANADATTDDGTVTEVTIAPEITVDWDGFDTAPDSIHVDVTAHGSNDSSLSGTRTVSESKSLSGAGLNGTSTVSMASYNLAGDNPFATSGFEAPSDGESVTRTITLDLEVKVYSGGTVTATDSSSGTTYDVIVTNQTATSSASGSANTGVN